MLYKSEFLSKTIVIRLSYALGVVPRPVGHFFASPSGEDSLPSRMCWLLSFHLSPKPTLFCDSLCGPGPGTLQAHFCAACRRLLGSATSGRERETARLEGKRGLALFLLLAILLSCRASLLHLSMALHLGGSTW